MARSSRVKNQKKKKEKEKKKKRYHRDTLSNNGDVETTVTKNGQVVEGWVRLAAAAIPHISHAGCLFCLAPAILLPYFSHNADACMSLYFTRDQPLPPLPLDHPPPRQTRDRIRILFFNVLSFIARAAAFYGGVTSVADNHDEKFIRRGFDFHRRRDRFLENLHFQE